MIDVLTEINSEIKALRKDVKAEKAKTIAKKDLRQRAETLGTKWFSEVSEPLSHTYAFSPDLLESCSQNFARLIKISSPNNLKKSYLVTLGALAGSFRDDLIIPLQKRPKSSTDASLLADILKGLPDSNENEYLSEAVDCAKHHYYRAAVVLGWCAAIDRMHKTIERIGFSTFNVTSSSMASQTKGRFKRFNSPQNVGSISELREVFDTVVLWILEGM